ncbi:MAG: hypothetical protein IT299_04410 [Dehalococcoidia bacterium]|nr:hypothetical protein [Dehalococcoidia bacterium]
MADGKIDLGVELFNGEPVRLGLRERQQGTYILGKPGTGKTTLIERMVLQDIEAGHGVCVLDPHGDLVDGVLVQIPAHREHDVILLDAADTDFPFGLNLFECRDLTDRTLVGRIAAQAVEVFEKLWGDISWGPQLAQTLRNSAYTMIENVGYTLLEVRRLLLDEEFRARLTANLTLGQVREFWELEYNPLLRREQQQRVSSTLNKIDEFLTPAVYPIVGLGRTTVDFRAAMDAGKVVLVKLPVGVLGGDPVALIGSMIVAQIFNAALSRQELDPGARRQFNLFADEYHRFATPTFAELLAEARKYGLATLLAHQFRDQLDEQNRGATLTAGNLLVFGVGGGDAEELAKQFDRTPPPPDVVGQRPKLTVNQRPIEHLVRHGHDSDFVRRAVAAWVQPLAHRVETMPSGGVAASTLRVPIEGRTSPIEVEYVADGGSLRAGAAAIDGFLVNVMERRLNLGTAAEISAIAHVIALLRAHICFAPELTFYDVDYPSVLSDPSLELPEATSRALLAFLTDWLPDRAAHRNAESHTRAGVLAHPAASRLVEARLSHLKWIDQQEQGMAESEALRNAGPFTTDLAPFVDEERRERARGHPHRAGTETYAAARLAWQLHTLALALLREPIFVDSGQWEPIYDRPRSYADVEGEIASRLVNLPKYQARGRLLVDTNVREVDVQTPTFENRQATEEGIARAERIRARSRRDYCLPLARVLEIIAARGRDDPPQESTRRRVPI